MLISFTASAGQLRGIVSRLSETNGEKIIDLIGGLFNQVHPPFVLVQHIADPAPKGGSLHPRGIIGEAVRLTLDEKSLEGVRVSSVDLASGGQHQGLEFIH